MVGFGNSKRSKELTLPDPRPIPPNPDRPEFYGEAHGTAYPKIDMQQLERDTVTDNLQEIAVKMRKLTYGEMVQLADEIKAIDPDAQVIKAENTLAGVLHEWSKRR